MWPGVPRACLPRGVLRELIYDSRHEFFFFSTAVHVFVCLFFNYMFVYANSGGKSQRIFLPFYIHTHVKEK